MLKLHATDWFTIRYRGSVAVIAELPQDLGLYDPTIELFKQKVLIDGKKYRVNGVETYAIARSKQNPYKLQFGLLVEEING